MILSQYFSSKSDVFLFPLSIVSENVRNIQNDSFKLIWRIIAKVTRENERHKVEIRKKI